MDISIAKTETRHYKSEGITFLRGLVCLYIVSCHLFSWCFSATRVDYIAGDIVKWLSRVTQPIGETNAGVIFFVVLSGYCIHRSKSIITLSKSDVLLYYKKRAARILPVLYTGILIGIILYVVSFDRVLTDKLTATDGIRFNDFLIRISGLNVFIPFGYEKSYLGNAPLATVLVEIYLYIIYPMILFLDKEKCNLWKRIYFLLWIIIFTFVLVRNEYYTWWENISIFCFFPYWYIGALFNKEERQFSIGEGGLLLLYALLFIPFKLNISFPILFIISEIRKLVFAIICGSVINLFDSKVRKISFPTFGILDIGKISYSLYVLHGPVLIWLLGAKIDIVSILIFLLVLCVIYYYVIEKKMSDILYNYLIYKK